MKSENLRQQALDLIYNFFVNSKDFNGIPLRNISEELLIEYEHSIDLIKQLINDGSVFLQSSTNPHIIGRVNNTPIETQIKIIDDAKTTEVKRETIGNIVISVEQTEFPICLYPSPSYLAPNRSFDEFNGSKFTTMLANAEPQLSFRFFETDVLEKYSNDPRFNFKFTDFYGDIHCAYDEEGNPLLREEDQVFLKSFGLGFDKDDNRLICVLLRDLSELSLNRPVFARDSIT